MKKKTTRLTFDRLESRIALTGCGAFGALVADVAHGNAADYGFVIPDGPASNRGSDVGNLKSAVGTDGNPDTHGVSERIASSKAFACGL